MKAAVTLARSGAAPAEAGSHRAARVVRAVAGCTVAALALVPAYRLLARPATGLAGAATIDAASTYAGLAVAGCAAFAIVALLAARLAPPATIARLVDRGAARLVSPSAVRFGAVVALVAGGAAALHALFIMDRQPALVDAMSQLVHARYIAAGSLGGPASAFAPFWHIQQTLVTDAGWVSQYPPLHVLLLAAGLVAGAAWLVGPLMLAAAVFFTALAADRLLPTDRAAARLGVALAAVSPFLLAHAGAYMSHTTAAALAAAALYFTTRALMGRAVWAAAAGAALGALLATRPLFAAALGAVLGAALVLDADGAGATRATSIVRRLGLLTLGALPFAALLGAYNGALFGHPLRFGYEAALGPAGGLGLGVDPWGNTYGLREAIGYTSAELHALGVALLEAPLPAAALVGAWFALARRVEPGAWLFAGWALAPVVAGLIYWHHGLYMGPRMLNETAPAWCVLAVLAAVWLVRTLPDRPIRGYAPRTGVAAGLGLAAIAGALVLGPLRLASYAQERPAALTLAATLPGSPLVFVHGSWQGRVAMRLAAGGMRLDSVETALRQNPTCAADRFANARMEGVALPLDLDARAGAVAEDPLARLRTIDLGPGSRARAFDGDRLGGACLREASSDRFGAIDITPLLWQADLPGLPARGALFVRDLGPERNAALIAALPDREPWLIARGPDGAPAVHAYESAVTELWNQGHWAHAGGAR